jgi:hypothetical protein
MIYLDEGCMAYGCAVESGPRWREAAYAAGSAAMMKSANMMLFSRVLAAVFGGYALTSGLAVLLSAVLPLSRAEAVLTATLSAFVVYTCAVIWVFAVQDLRRAWLGMLLPAIVCGGMGMLLSRGAA